MFLILRRIGFPLRLVAARLAVGGQRLLLVAVGVVAGAAVLAAVLGGRLVMQDRALTLATNQLPAGGRIIEVVWGGANSRIWPRLNRFVTPKITQVNGTPGTAAMLFREASIQGRLVNLRAADDLGRWVTLLSGRLPSACVPEHCEVLRLAGKGPIPSTPYLRLVEVGRAVLKPDAPFGPLLLPAPHTEEVARAVRYHTPQPSPIVIANGVAGLARTQELETFYRLYAWDIPIKGGDVHPWSVGAFAKKVQRLTAEIEASSQDFQVTAPTQELADATSSSTAAARRLLLLGGEGGALLLAFTILAAAALRRDVTDARRRLTWFGARRWQVELFTLTESLALAGLSTVAGWIGGGGVAAAIAGRAGSPPGQVVTHALLSQGGILAAVAIAIAAGLLLYAAVRAPSVQLGRLAVTPLDAAALGAVAVVLVGWARGSVSAGQLGATGNGASAFVLLVPALIVFAAAVVAARLLVPALRAIGRAGRRGPIALRLAAASLARNQGHAAIAATFLVASLGLALFALTYRSTLLRGQHDEANFTVPASFVLSEDLRQLIPVLHSAPLSSYPAQPIQVLRLTGDVPAGKTFTFLGLPANDMGRVGGWRGDFARDTPAQLGAAIAPGGNTSLRVDALPPGRTFTLPVTARGDDIGVSAIFRSKLDDFDEISLGHTNGPHPTILHARIPFRHGTLAQLRFSLLGNLHGSANGGTGIQPSAKGIITFGTPRVDGTAVRNAFAGWRGDGGISGTARRIGYILTPENVPAYRPAQPTDGHALPVLVTPAIAAEAGPRGILPLEVEGEHFAVRVVGVVQRFPSIVGDAVVADRRTASTLLNTSAPATGTTDELWLDVPGSQERAAAAKLAQLPFARMIVSSRAATLARLQADPLARGALLTLAGTALVALLLALVGLLLTVVGDIRDDRGELFDLEAQGAAPATIRAHLRLRALLVAVFGVIGGVGLGAILSSLVISLVTVTASAATPEPPLRLVADLPLLALAAAAYVLTAAVLVGAATRLRGDAPARTAEVLA